MPRVVILGAGVMGSAMAVVAGDRGHRVALVGTHLDEDVVRAVTQEGRHPRLDVSLPRGVTGHRWEEFREVMAEGADLLILGVASAGVPWAVDRLCEALRGPLPVVMITKGLAPVDGTIAILPELVAREVEARSGLALPVMAVGGPCIAGELAARRDTGVVITGRDPALVQRVIAMLEVPYYHARPSSDVVGVEVCAAFKNFYAIGVGWAQGRLERDGRAGNGAYMHNPAASLFAQALREMEILVRALGGDATSVHGMPGTGDLYVTCQAGRNSRMGRLLGLGLTYRAAKDGHMAADTVEGAELALALGPTLDALMAEGRLPAGRLPLTRAIVGAVCRDEPLDVRWEAFHRDA